MGLDELFKIIVLACILFHLIFLHGCRIFHDSIEMQQTFTPALPKSKRIMLLKGPVRDSNQTHSALCKWQNIHNGSDRAINNSSQSTCCYKSKEGNWLAVILNINKLSPESWTASLILPKRQGKKGSHVHLSYPSPTPYTFSLPCGSPPPFGDRFVQKMVWLMWPPPLNFRAGCSATWAVTSPVTQHHCWIDAALHTSVAIREKWACLERSSWHISHRSTMHYF